MNSSLILIFILTAFCFCLIIYSIFVTIKLVSMSKELKNSKNSQEILSGQYDSLKSFKHDFENMVSILGGFIKNEDMVNLKKYYKNLFEECQELNNFSNLNSKVINNSGIYNLLLLKYKKAQEANVKINLECFIDFNNLHISIYKFSRILGIFIDNAIEAASDSSEKFVSIRFRDSKINKTQIVIIENTYADKSVDTAKIFEKGISSKNNHSGIGLWKVNQIIENNKNLNLVTTKDEKYFRQQLEIYY